MLVFTVVRIIILYGRLRALRQNIRDFGPCRFWTGHFENGVGSIVDDAIIVPQMRIDCEKQLVRGSERRCGNSLKDNRHAFTHGFRGFALVVRLTNLLVAQSHQFFSKAHHRIGVPKLQ